MIEFVYGVSGSGKSTYVSDLIKRDTDEGKEVYLIVPEQETYINERRYTKLLPPSAQLTFEVVNFTRLANKSFRRFGGLSYNYIDPATRALLMWKNLRELGPLLEEYQNATVTPSQTAGLVSLMLSASKELKAAGVTPAALERAAEKLPFSHGLRSRLRDISLICAAFEGLVSENYDDGADDLGKLASILEEHDFFSGKSVYIDSFTSYTASEYEIIRKIMAQADSLVVTLGCDSPDTDRIHFLAIKDTSDRLHELASGRGGAKITLLGEPKRFLSNELKVLEKHLWSIDSADIPDCDRIPAPNITIYSCDSPYSEAEAAANRILQELRGGMRCRDIAVIMRDATSYVGIIDAVFEKYGIPFFLSERSDLSNKPLIKLILSALRIKNRNWRQSDVMTNIKTGLCGFSDRECDIFEDYCSVWNISGRSFIDDDWSMNPDGFTTERSERADEILAVANDVRRRFTAPLLALFSELDASKDARGMCRALFDYTEKLGVREGLAELAARESAAGYPRAAGETLRIYDIFVGTLEKVTEALGDAELSSEEFYEVLKLVFDNTTIGSLPTRQDEVTIGSASLLRVDSPRLVIAMGLNDGVFPAEVSEGSILNAHDRAVLAGLGIKLSSDPALKYSEELFFAYRALTSPSEALQISFATHSASGSLRTASSAVNRIMSIFPDIKVIKYEELEPIERIQTLKSALEYYKMLPEESAAEVRRILEENEETAELLRMMDLPLIDKNGSISPELAERLFGRNISVSQSRLESYAKCGFKFFCEHVLRLREEGKAEFASNHAGTFLHYVLEKFMKQASLGGKFNPDISDEEANRLAERIISEYTDKIIPHGHERESRLAFLFERLRRIATVLILDIREEFRHSSFIPAFYELPLDGSSKDFPEPASITSEDGTNINLRGVVDRVDLFKHGNDVYIRVVDYKSGKKVFSPSEIEKGLGLQLLLYLFALCRSQSKDFRRAVGCGPDGKIYPAGALYLSAKLPVITVDEQISEDEIIRQAMQSMNRSGPLLCDDEILKAMNDRFDKHYLAGTTLTSKGIKGNFLQSAEEFDMLYDIIRDTIGKITNRLRQGEACAEPVITKGESPCNFCPYGGVCRCPQMTNDF